MTFRLTFEYFLLQAAHEYFGTQKVVKDLQGMPGWQSGLLHFDYGLIARAEDGRVLGYQAARLHPRERA